MLARRAEWAPTEEVLVPASDVVAGDFIVRVPTQGNFRGTKIDATVVAVAVNHDRWGQNSYKGGRRFPVEGRVFSFNDDNGRRWAPAVDIPAALKVVVRRAVPA